MSNITESHRIRLAKLARIDHRLAELLGEQAELMASRARIADEMAEGQAINLETGRRLPRAHHPKIPQVSDTDRARALSALQGNAHRRRLRA